MHPALVPYLEQLVARLGDVAAQHAIPVVGPPWSDVFSPVQRNSVLDALGESLAWHEREEPVEANGVLNACRAWHWLETGEWHSKPEAAAWVRERVRGALEATR